MKYSVIKNENGFFEFRSLVNNNEFNTTIENINENIDIYNQKISQEQVFSQIINYMNDNNIQNYNSYIHGVWHDENFSIKVVLTHEQNTVLIRDYPELLAHVLDEENEILHIVENGYVYIYVNFFLEGHEQLLLMYGAKIFNNN